MSDKEASKAKAEKYKLIRWAIAAVTLLIVAGGAYWVLSAPARLAGDIKDQVSDAAGGMDMVRPVPAPKRTLGKASEAAFEVLEAYPPQPPADMNARAFNLANFRGSENRICQFTLDFGAGDVPVFIAADIKAHATEKQLGSQAGRLIRMVIQTPGQDLPLRSYYDEEAGAWKLRWRRLMATPPVSDKLAGERAIDVLEAAERCAVETP